MVPGTRALKRRLLRELVADNVELIRGRAGVRRRTARRRPAWGLALLALLPAALVAPSFRSDPVSPGADRGPGAAPVETAAAAPAVDRRPRPERASPAAIEGAAAPLDTAVFPLAVERVAIDPGHGGGRPGTRTPSGLAEKELTLDIARRLGRLLERDGYQVVMTREADVDVPLAERTRRANQAGADLFVSLHVNWIENRGVRGVETYFLGPTDDPFLTRLAAAENRDSGYALADLKSLVEQLYVGARQDESRRLAGAVQEALLASLRTLNPEVEDRGVKSAPFIVLMKTEMPAVLAEVSCLSNEREAELLAKPLYRQFLAEAVLAGIRGYSEALENPEPKGMES
jgi:N-acetylmuramoyl-L-alanine amidase